jgi:hypothetical protein
MSETDKLLKLLKRARRHLRRNLIGTALICIGPPLHLIFDLTEKNMDKLGRDIIMTIVTVCFFIYFWSSYKKKLILFEEIKEQILKEES